MLSFQVEKLKDILSEIKPILPLHYEELALNKDKVPLDPQWETYLTLDEIEMLFIVTARQDGKLVGYYLALIQQGLHYATCKTCTTDIFYLKKEYRLNGDGFKMFKFIEEQLDALGVQRWVVSFKCHLDASKFFEKLNFKRIEIVYSKMLGS